MLQPMMGAAKNVSARTPASARSLQPDPHGRRNRDIMSVMKIPSRRRRWSVRRVSRVAGAVGGPTLIRPTIGRD